MFGKEVRDWYKIGAIVNRVVVNPSEIRYAHTDLYNIRRYTTKLNNMEIKNNRVTKFTGLGTYFIVKTLHPSPMVWLRKNPTQCFSSYNRGMFLGYLLPILGRWVVFGMLYGTT